MQQLHLLPHLALLGLLVFPASGCGDDGSSSDGADSDQDPSAGDTSGSGGPGGNDETSASSAGPTADETGPGASAGETGGASPTDLFVVGSQIFTPDGMAASYLITTDALSGGRTLDTEGAPEIIGRALIAGPLRGGMVFVGTGDAPELTRYDLDAEGTLVEGDAVNFGGLGVGGIGEYASQIQFVSDTKAYYFDNRTHQLVIWNPDDMTITDTVDLAELAVEGALTVFAQHPPLEQDGVLFMPVGWRVMADNSIAPGAGMVVVDTADDSVAIATDERCGYVREAVAGSDGYFYLATEAYGAAFASVAPDVTPAPCLLRFDPEARAYDAAFSVELADLVEGATAGSLIPAGEGEAFVRVLDPTLSSEEVPRFIAGEPAWRWWRLALGDTPTGTLVDALPPTSASVFRFHTADRLLIPEAVEDGMATAFRDVTGGEDGGIVATAPGTVFSLVQIR